MALRAVPILSIVPAPEGPSGAEKQRNALLIACLHQPPRESGSVQPGRRNSSKYPNLKGGSLQRRKETALKFPLQLRYRFTQ